MAGSTLTIRLLRRTAVEELCGLSRSAIYVAMERGNFPRPVSTGPRSVRWRSDEISQWIESRPHVEAGRFDAD